MSRRYWIGAAVTLLGVGLFLIGNRLRSASFSLEHVEEYTGDAEPTTLDAHVADE